MSQPQDRVLPASQWADPRWCRLGAPCRLSYLYLVACADRDGIAAFTPFNLLRVARDGTPDRPERERERAWCMLDRMRQAGLVLPYRGPEPGDTWWAWLPDVPSTQPSQGKLRPELDATRPAPPTDQVLELLAERLGREATERDGREACPRAWGRKRRTAAGVPAKAVRAVFDSWRRHQAQPDSCHLAPPVQRMIKGALGQASVEQLVALVGDYAHEAEDAGPRYWRGANAQARTYLGLDNLLRADKLQGRVQAMLAWNERQAGPSDAQDGVDLGAYGRARGLE